MRSYEVRLNEDTRLLTESLQRRESQRLTLREIRTVTERRGIPISTGVPSTVIELCERGRMNVVPTRRLVEDVPPDAIEFEVIPDGSKST